MRQFIDGTTYDTSAASLVAIYSNGLPPSDIERCEEVLYRKATGEYFLHGVGGALTRWHDLEPGGGCLGGEGIAPLTEAEACDWVDSHARA